MATFLLVLLTQKKFTLELIKEAEIINGKATVTPLPLHLKFKADDGELYSYPSKYRYLVGKLNFLTHIRPDMSYTVQRLSRFL